MMDIKTLSGKYLRWMLRLACYSYIIYKVACVGMRICGYDDLAGTLNALLEAPMIISEIFVILTALLFVMLWRIIARKSPESLTVFYNASSGLRMLLALAVISVYYMICGSEMITPFALTFMVVYFLQLIVHSVFFTKYLK